MKETAQTIYYLILAIGAFVFVLILTSQRYECSNMLLLYDHFGGVRVNTCPILICKVDEFREVKALSDEDEDSSLFLALLVNKVIRDAYLAKILLINKIPRKYVLYNVLQGCLLSKIHNYKIDYKYLEDLLIRANDLCVDDMSNKACAIQKFSNYLTYEKNKYETGQLLFLGLKDVEKVRTVILSKQIKENGKAKDQKFAILLLKKKR